MIRRALSRTGHAVLLVLLTIGIAAAMLHIAGFDVGRVGDAAWRGAFGSFSAVVSATLKRATPLMLLGIAVAVAFRAGVLNIGADGQFLAGATSSVATGLLLAGSPSFLVLGASLCAGVAAGAVWAALAAWLRARFAVAEVVSTLLLNFVAANFVGYLVRGLMQEPTHAYPQSAILPVAARLPQLVPGERLHAGFAIAVLACVVAAWAFDRTAAGFRAKVVGLNPRAAESAGGVSAIRVQARALIVSGGLAGLAGFCETSGVTYALYEGLSPGYGYTAIAVALLGGLRPSGVAAAAIFFGALGAGADAVQRDAGVPAEMASVVAALVILGLLVAPRVRSGTQPAGAK
jgi:simple sugar transport system permease protein